jgi:hypothetical protein
VMLEQWVIVALAACSRNGSGAESRQLNAQFGGFAQEPT